MATRQGWRVPSLSLLTSVRGSRCSMRSPPSEAGGSVLRRHIRAESCPLLHSGVPKVPWNLTWRSTSCVGGIPLDTGTASTTFLLNTHIHSLGNPAGSAFKIWVFLNIPFPLFPPSSRRPSCLDNHSHIKIALGSVFALL